METKIIEKVREQIKSYPGKNGMVFVHGITVKGDPIEWEYHSKMPTCDKFQPNVEATFVTEVTTHGQYTNHKISPIYQNKPFGGGGNVKPQGTITALSAVSTAANFLADKGSIVSTEENLFKLAEKIFQWAKSK